jgi:altered-inheritance-of-mitochondria protein 13
MLPLTLLSEHIRSKLASSLASLKAQEAQLTSQLHASLSQSNTQHESSSSSSGTHSQILSRDIEEVREKVRRIENKKSLADWPEVGAMKERVRECYLSVSNARSGRPGQECAVGGDDGARGTGG